MAKLNRRKTTINNFKKYKSEQQREPAQTQAACEHVQQCLLPFQCVVYMNCQSVQHLHKLHRRHAIRDQARNGSNAGPE